MARVVFMGTPEFAVPSLARLLADGHEVVAVVTQPDRPAGRGRRSEAPPVKDAALKHGLAVLQPESVNRPEFLTELRSAQPEVGVVAAFGQLLGKRVLAIPPRGYLNVHASLLPRHRGASPIAAAILAGDGVTGVSVMLIDEGLDTGPVLTRETTPIPPEETSGRLELRLAAIGADLLARTLPGWMTGALQPEPQVEALATFAGRVEKDAGRAVWALPASRLARMARAYDPWPGLFAFVREEGIEGAQRIRLLRVRQADEPLPGLSPGEVAAGRSVLTVATGDGALELLEVQPAGKGPMSSEAFRRGRRGAIRFE